MLLFDQDEHLGQSIAYARSNSVVPLCGNPAFKFTRRRLTIFVEVINVSSRMN